MYSEYFKGMLSGTSAATAVQSVRDVGDAHAFVDCDQTITGADGQVVLAVHLTALLRRDGDSWGFVDARPYTFPEIPSWSGRRATSGGHRVVRAVRRDKTQHRSELGAESVRTI